MVTLCRHTVRLVHCMATRDPIIYIMSFSSQYTVVWVRFRVEMLLCDYEIGLHNAVTNTWPNTTLRGCHFHYTQALWRHLQCLDLVPEYQVESSPIRAAFKMLNALPFVPENLITTAWGQLRQLLSITTRGPGLVQHTLIRSFPIPVGTRVTQPPSFCRGVPT